MKRFTLTKPQKLAQLKLEMKNLVLIATIAENRYTIQLEKIINYLTIKLNPNESVHSVYSQENFKYKLLVFIPKKFNIVFS